MRRVLVVFLLAVALLALAPATHVPLQWSAAAQQKQAGNPYAKVWVDTAYGIYHCPGSQWYGKTKYGLYMYQYQAQQRGYQPYYGWLCK